LRLLFSLFFYYFLIPCSSHQRYPFQPPFFSIDLKIFSNSFLTMGFSITNFATIGKLSIAVRVLLVPNNPFHILFLSSSPSNLLMFPLIQVTLLQKLSFFAF